MELRQLRYFVAVAEERHFARAPRRLRLPAPSLSQQIKVLERDLLVTLFDRTSHGVMLTPAGEVLLEHARVLLDRAERARSEVRRADGRHRHMTLRVAPGVEHILQRALTRLSEPGSGLEVTAATTTDSDAIRAVRHDQIDAAIVWVRTAHDQDLSGVVLHRASLYLALPVGHRLAAAEVVQVADLAAETIVMTPRELFTGIWDHVIAHLLPSGLARVDQVLTPPNLINAPEALLRAVAAGYGVAPVAPAVAEHIPIPGIVVRPLVPPMLAPLELIWHEPAHPALRHLVALLADPEMREPTAIPSPERARRGGGSESGRPLTTATLGAA